MCQRTEGARGNLSQTKQAPVRTGRRCGGRRERPPLPDDKASTMKDAGYHQKQKDKGDKLAKKIPPLRVISGEGLNSN